MGRLKIAMVGLLFAALLVLVGIAGPATVYAPGPPPITCTVSPDREIVIQINFGSHVLTLTTPPLPPDTVDRLCAWSQPHILVRNFDASLSNCDFSSPNQSVFVESFHLVNTGPAAGYADVAITVDGNVVRTYTFLVLSGEDRIFRPSEDALHSFSPSDDTIPLQGCSAQVVGNVVGNVWRA